MNSKPLFLTAFKFSWKKIIIALLFALINVGTFGGLALVPVLGIIIDWPIRIILSIVSTVTIFVPELWGGPTFIIASLIWAYLLICIILYIYRFILWQKNRNKGVSIT